MHMFWLILHVLGAVMLTGPLLLAPMTGLRALRQRDEIMLKHAGHITAQFALLSLITLGLGLIVVASSKSTDFSTPWIVISITLFLIALALALFVSAPALNKSASMVLADTDQERKEQAEAQSPTARQQDPEELRKITDARIMAHSAARERLQDQRGKVAAASGTTAVLLIVVTILMVTQPFG
ncbi:MAG: DUF2269 family protein [Mycobacteriales bacterium]